MPNLEHLLEGRIRMSDTTYKLDEIRAGINGNIIWPMGDVVYMILTNTITLRYSSGNKILANASNYAYVTATVQAWRGSTMVSEGTETLSITGISDSVSFEVRAGTRLYGKNHDGYRNGMGAVSFPDGLTCSIMTYGAHGVTISNRPLTVIQQENKPTKTGEDKVYTSYTIDLNETDFTSTGGTAVVTSTAFYKYTPTYTWTSGTVSEGETTYNNPESVTPETLSVNPSSGVQINAAKTRITFPANTSGADVDYMVYASWNGFDAIPVTVMVSAVTHSYTYDSCEVVNYHYEDAPASGGPVYPIIGVRCRCYLNGAFVGYLTGGVDDGSTTVVLSNSSVGHSTTGQIEYRRGSNGSYPDADGGRVQGNDLGTTPKERTAIASGNYARSVWFSKGSSVASSSVLTVYQEANEAVTIPASNTCTALTITLSPSSINTAAATRVSVTAKASGRSVTARVEYTSGHHTGGIVSDYTNQSVTLDTLTVNGTSQSDKTGFTASNAHNTSSRTHNVSGTYAGKSATASVQQAADRKIDATKDYVVSVAIGSNSVWAGGGYATISANASHTKYKYWESGGSSDVVSGSAESIPDTPVLSLVDLSSAGAFTLSGNTVTHRDMKRLVRTDSVKVKAVNGIAESTTSALTATNALGSTEYVSYGAYTWGASYPGYRNYKVNLAVSNYISETFPAPYTGGSATVTASGSHEEATLRDGTRPKYTDRRYSSWSPEKDDDDHRVRTTTTDTKTGDIVTDWHSVTDTSTVSENLSWASISGNTVTIDPQPQDGRARNGNIIATNGSAEKSVTIYQAGYAAISVNTSSLVFPWTGGTKTFVVTAHYTMWELTYASSQTPVTNVQPVTGGDIRYRNVQTTVTVTCGRNDRPAYQFGTIRITPSISGLSQITVGISQEPYDGSAPTD